MELTQLEYFRTIAHVGNMSRAAKELFISQPNLSRSMTNLERELGVPLFERRKGRIELNEYGMYFLSTVTAVLDGLNSGVHSLQKLFDDKQSVLKLGCPIDDFLPDMLKQFSFTNPHIGIYQIKMPQKDIEQGLIRQTIDLAILPHPPEHKHINFRVLSESRYILLASKKHPFADKAAISLKQLKRERFVCDASRMAQARLRMICNSAGFEPEIGYEVDNTGFLYDLVEADNGISLIPYPQYEKLQGNALAERLVGIELEDTDIPHAEIGLAYCDSYKFSTAANAFICFAGNWL